MNQITILNFSGRNNGNCSAISEYIKTFYSDSSVFEFHIDQNYGSCGGCNYECLIPGAMCPKRDDFQNQVMDTMGTSDLIYYIVPNYCGLPCANYYAFNERCTGYFNMDRELMKKFQSVKRRFIVVSNTETDAFAQAMKMQSGTEPEILYMKTSKYGKRSTAGDIQESEAARADLEDFLSMVTL